MYTVIVSQDLCNDLENLLPYEYKEILRLYLLVFRKRKVIFSTSAYKNENENDGMVRLSSHTKLSHDPFMIRGGGSFFLCSL